MPSRIQSPTFNKLLFFKAYGWRHLYEVVERLIKMKFTRSDGGKYLKIVEFPDSFVADVKEQKYETFAQKRHPGIRFNLVPEDKTLEIQPK